MNRRAVLTAAITALCAGAISALPASAVSADPLPQGRTVWLRDWSKFEVRIVVVRRGQHVKIVSPDVTHKGTIEGNVMRLRPNEGLGDVTYDRFRVRGDVLSFRWEGQSKWTRFIRVS